MPENKELEKASRELDLHYIPSRYPDAFPSGTPTEYYDEDIRKAGARMGKEGSGICEEEFLRRVPRWASQICTFCKRAVARHRIKAIILYGSMATGAYTDRSDIDLIVIAEDLPSDYLERLRSFLELSEPDVPLEILAYTPKEFDTMIKDASITALDALTQGIPLFGEDYFLALRDQVKKMLDSGLTRTDCTWRWLPAVE